MTQYKTYDTPQVGEFNPDCRSLRLKDAEGRTLEGAKHLYWYTGKEHGGYKWRMGDRCYDKGSGEWKSVSCCTKEVCEQSCGRGVIRRRKKACGHKPKDPYQNYQIGTETGWIMRTPAGLFDELTGNAIESTPRCACGQPSLIDADCKGCIDKAFREMHQPPDNSRHIRATLIEFLGERGV